MGEIKENKIMIKDVSPSDPGHKLVGCYFMPKTKQNSDTTYNFHDRDNKVKERDLTVGSEFTVELLDSPGTKWTLTINSGTTESVDGNWWDAKRDPGMEDGTYQAQAGGAEAEEDAASAYA